MTGPAGQNRRLNRTLSALNFGGSDGSMVSFPMVMLIGDGVGPPQTGLAPRAGCSLPRQSPHRARQYGGIEVRDREHVHPRIDRDLDHAHVEILSGIAHVRVFREITGADIPKRDAGPQAKPVAAKLEGKPEVIAGCFVEGDASIEISGRVLDVAALFEMKPGGPPDLGPGGRGGASNHEDPKEHAGEEF